MGFFDEVQTSVAQVSKRVTKTLTTSIINDNRDISASDVIYKERRYIHFEATPLNFLSYYKKVYYISYSSPMLYLLAFLNFLIVCNNVKYENIEKVCYYYTAHTITSSLASTFCSCLYEAKTIHNWPLVTKCSTSAQVWVFSSCKATNSSCKMEAKTASCLLT